MKAQPYTEADLKKGEDIVKDLHSLKGHEIWAEHIAKAIAAERYRVLNNLDKFL